MNTSLTHHNIVITGGAVRLGRAMALACAAAGAGVAITYRSREAEALQTVAEMEAACPQPGARFAALRCEVTDDQQVADLPQRAREALGDVTGLINNAAIFRRTPFEVMDAAAFDSHINTNLRAPYLLCRAFGEIFKHRGQGAILNMADIHGQRPLRHYVPYCISKAGVIMLTEALALALAPEVRVNCLCPGTILEPAEDQGVSQNEEDWQRRIPLRRLGSAEEIAEAAIFLLGGPAYITGICLPVDGAARLRC